MISFENYGILYSFDLVKYALNNAPVETVFNPGLITKILGLATFPNDFNSSLIENWAAGTSTAIADTNLGFKARQNYILASELDPLGGFRFFVLLKRVFGFADDYGKLMYGLTQSLILTRSSTDNNVLCIAAAGVEPGAWVLMTSSANSDDVITSVNFFDGNRKF